MSSNNTSTSTVLLAALGGAVVGAGLALLYAPQSGARTRKKLQAMGEDAGDYAQGVMDDARDGFESAKRKGEEWILKGQDLVEEKKRQLAAAMDGAGKHGH